MALRIVSRLAEISGNQRLVRYVDEADPRIICTASTSFIAGTQVLTASGLRSIESLVRGDLVATRQQQLESIQYEPIAKTHTRIADDFYLIKTSIGDIEATGEHPFYLHDQGWVRARDLSLIHI